ncbi:hypothetical protein A5892_12810 [Halotalea alkalilenta]|uniref:DUF808 domain-containing protein n=2 Tax=Halotalea alkalilenta TaxID=376489 RepID=A0A172YG39_9GAMM|nr:hypothetical protein A5892_12810 [Halotalea alkalilenta]
MAGGSLLTLLDDIATLLDDVSVLTKVAAKKTAGVVGDDMALNAQQLTGVPANRELPIVWAVAKGSFLNKLILVPVALLISAMAPWLITPLLMLGGAFLCYEGAEKLLHRFLHKNEDRAEQVRAAARIENDSDRLAFEKDKIKGAIMTDFILSAEIIAITLGSVAGSEFVPQVIVLSIVAIGITVLVYGLVAGIVKVDDFGLYLTKQSSQLVRSVGNGILWLAPYFMKLLSIVGTIAMFLVGGGILVHGVPFIQHGVEAAAETDLGIPSISVIIMPIMPMLFNFIAGIVVGGIIVAVVMLFKKLKPAATPKGK